MRTLALRFQTLMQVLRDTASRWWSERQAGFRAINPAWPLAVVVIAVIAAFVFSEQGRVALLISSEVDNSPRVPILGFVTGVFSIAIMLLATYAMSLRRYVHTQADRSPIDLQRGEAPPDRVHTSVLLRLRTAFLIGIAVPLAMLAVFIAASSDTADEGWILAWLFLVAVLLSIPIGGIIDGQLQGARFALLKAPQTWRSGHLAWKNEVALPLSRMDQARSVLVPILYHGAHHFFSFLAWWLRPDQLALLTAAAISFVFSGRVDDEYKTGYVSVALGAGGAAAMFFWLRERTMRVVGMRDRKHLIVDRTGQTIQRGLATLLSLCVLICFGMIYQEPDIVTVVGPASALMMGAFLVANILVWFVRNAMGPAPLDKPGQVRVWRPQSIATYPASDSGSPRWFALFGRALSTVHRSVLWFLRFVGRISEILQSALPAHRIFFFGALWFAIDFGLNSLTALAPHGAGWPYTIFVLAAAVAVAAFITWLTHWLALEPHTRATGSGFLATAASKLRLIPDERRTPRLPSLLLLAPFVLATLGATGTPRYQMVAEETSQLQRQSIDLHAQRWLENAQRASDQRAIANGRMPGKDPIVAIVVLAEGGGIRAAAHAAAVLSKVEKKLANDRQLSGGLYGNAFAISSVSGGAIGVSAYLAGLHTSKAACASQRCDVDVEAVNAALNKDYLTPLIAGLFGPDLLSVFIPFDLPMRLREAAESEAYTSLGAHGQSPFQRTAFFERSLSHPWSKSGALSSNPMELSLEQVAADLRPTDAPGPVVMFSTFGADAKLRAVVANVDFANCRDALTTDLAGRLVTFQSCLEAQGARRCRRAEMPLAAAAHLSGRFPGSNPPATVRLRQDGGSAGAPTPSETCADAPATDAPPVFIPPKDVRFVDGGYFDNSGAAAASEAVAPLLDAARNGLAERLRIVVVHLFARGHDDAERRDIEARPMLSEISAPIEAFVNARESSAFIPVASLCRQVAKDPVGAQDTCESLGSWRHRPLSGEDRMAQSIVGRASAPGLYWINAALDYGEDRRDPDHYLLGWHMRAASHEEIAKRAAHLAEPIAQAIIAAAMPAPTQSTNPTSPESLGAAPRAAPANARTPQPATNPTQR